MFPWVIWLLCWQAEPSPQGCRKCFPWPLRESVCWLLPPRDAHIPPLMGFSGCVGGDFLWLLFGEELELCPGALQALELRSCPRPVWCAGDCRFKGRSVLIGPKRRWGLWMLTPWPRNVQWVLFPPGISSSLSSLRMEAGQGTGASRQSACVLSTSRHGVLVYWVVQHIQQEV